MALLEAYWHPAGMENAFSGMPRIQLIGIEAIRSGISATNVAEPPLEFRKDRCVKAV